MIRSKSALPLALFLVAAFAPGRLAAQDDLRKRIGDTGGTRTDVWVYNDIAKAIDRARRENKPIFVVFRARRAPRSTPTWQTETSASGSWRRRSSSPCGKSK
jgi:hypothetical protein